MHFHTDLSGIDDGCHVGSDDCCDSCFLGCVKCALHVLKIFSEESDVEGEICLHSVFRADAHDLCEVGHLEVVGRMRAHVKLLDSEVY